MERKERKIRESSLLIVSDCVNRFESFFPFLKYIDLSIIDVLVR